MQKKDKIIAPFNNPLIRLISDANYRWLRHLLFILVGLILAFKGDIGVPETMRPVRISNAILLVDAISFVIIISLLYLMVQLAVPKLLFRSKVFLFGLTFIATVIIVFVTVWTLDNYIIAPVTPASYQHIQFNLLNFIQIGTVCSVLIGAVVGMKVFKKWITDVQHINELHQVNAKVELEQLKSQVNPHFLFNTLNNLLVLTRTDTEKASQVLLGLSDLLRYQLYDSTKDKIMLAKDISFIQNLLALEKIRKNDFEYVIHTDGNVDGQLLPPFLFIPFVENAIKHGASTVGHSYLMLYFRVSGKKLFFSAENSRPAIRQNATGGLGLSNIKRRLELLYPGSHTLEIQDEPEKYLVNLTIPL